MYYLGGYKVDVCKLYVSEILLYLVSCILLLNDDIYVTDLNPSNVLWVWATRLVSGLVNYTELRHSA